MRTIVNRPERRGAGANSHIANMPVGYEGPFPKDRLALCEQRWERLLAGQRFEDHPRARPAV